MNRTPLIVNDLSFRREVLEHSRPVVAAFLSQHCGHCRRFEPELTQAAVQDRTGARFVKLLLEDAPALFAQYRVNATPTTLLFRGGLEIARLPGAVTAAQLLSWLAQHALPQAA